MTTKGKNIIKKVAELYSFGNRRHTTEEVAEMNYKKLLVREEEWSKAFEKFPEEECIKAIYNFWRWHNDKTRPSVAQLLATHPLVDFDSAKDDKKLDEIKEDIPEQRFYEDIKLGICHHNLYIYRDAYKLVKQDKNLDFNDALKQASLARNGREYEFASDEDIIANGKNINPKMKYQMDETKWVLESVNKKCTLTTK